MKKILYFAITAMALVACNKEFATSDSSYLPGSAAAEMVEKNPEFLASYINGVYAYMVDFNTSGSSNSPHDDYGLMSVGHNLELMGESLAIIGTMNWGLYDAPHDYGAYNYSRPFQFWNFFYSVIAKCNEIIDFFGAEDPTNEILRGYLGQAYAARAMSYTYLMFIFQDPASGNFPNAKFEAGRPASPIIYATRDGKTTTEATEKAGRNTLGDLCEEVERNLALAETLLDGYVRSSKNEIDATVLCGIAARYYLLTQQWGKAATYAHNAQAGYTVLPASQVATNGFMEVTDPEVMWGFNHSTETATSYASFFSMSSNECSGYTGLGHSIHCINKALYDKIPVSDVRKAHFNGPDGDPSAANLGGKQPYAARKFGYMANWLQDYIYMRVEEMILTEAEALLCNNDPAGAKTALTKLMNQRDNLWTSEVTLEEILFQRRVELWGEGFEYFDLRRTAMDVVRKYPGSNHLPAHQFDFLAHDPSWNFQIPLRETQENAYISEDEDNEYESPVE